jgi:hypothetical protein
MASQNANNFCDCAKHSISKQTSKSSFVGSSLAGNTGFESLKGAEDISIGRGGRSRGNSE